MALLVIFLAVVGREPGENERALITVYIIMFILGPLTIPMLYKHQITIKIIKTYIFPSLFHPHGEYEIGKKGIYVLQHLLKSRHRITCSSN